METLGFHERFRSIITVFEALSLMIAFGLPVAAITKKEK
ncbi:putative holin-like toxin [Agrilactobacillus composti]